MWCLPSTPDSYPAPVRSLLDNKPPALTLAPSFGAFSKNFSATLVPLAELLNALPLVRCLIVCAALALKALAQKLAAPSPNIF